jgi:cob(I)alamin adenosyltransferase
VKWLEAVIDECNEELEPLTSFILPTGAFHLARSIARRAEREVWRIEEDINPEIAKYLNRLSDVLFVLARHHNREKLWKPMGKNEQ